MNELLRDRILRRLDGLPDERLYQVLDYIEYLDSKYAARQAPPPNILSRSADWVEDQLRASRMSATAVAETMGLLSRAMNVLNGVAAAGKSVASDIVSVAKAAAPGGQDAQATPDSPASPPQPQPPGTQPKPHGDARP
jgi:hypothetical protein